MEGIGQSQQISFGSRGMEGLANADAKASYKPGDRDALMREISLKQG